MHPAKRKGSEIGAPEGSESFVEKGRILCSSIGLLRSDWGGEIETVWSF